MQQVRHVHATSYRWATVFVGCVIFSACSDLKLKPPAAPSLPVIVAGRVTSTSSSAALSGLAVTANVSTCDQSNSPSSPLKPSGLSDAGGFFALEVPCARGRGTLTFSGSGIVPRTVLLTSERMHVAADAIELGGGFDLDFYRQIVRDAFDRSGQLLALRRWTSAPMIMLKTVDEAGQPVDAVTLDTTAAVLTATAPAFTGGRFGLAGIERGTQSREGLPGWITVKWPNPPLADFCGRAQVAVNGGWMELNYLRANCGGSCAVGSRISPGIVRHELGHALGFFHSGNSADLMFGLVACAKDTSNRERFHAAIAYSRLPGNLDPDTDSDSTTGFFQVPRPIVVVD